MVDIPTFVRSLVEEPRTDHLFFECRNCGTTFERQREVCPRCDRPEIARYDFDDF